MFNVNRAVSMAAILIGLSHSTCANAGLAFEVNFNDPGSSYSSYYAGIAGNVISAGNQWASHFNAPSGATTLSVSVGFAPIATGNGTSATTNYVGTRNGLPTFEQSAAYELRTGIDPNGAAADIVFNLGTLGYLQNELWFDMTPDDWLDDAVPTGQTDARSVFLHEFGHAFGFNGWLDAKTGLLPGAYQSTFDAQTLMFGTPQGDTVFFTGQQAQAVYGGLVPLTFGNHGHVGNGDGRGGAGLIPDLMNGVVFTRGTRYDISALDLAILADIGLPMADGPRTVPEPGSLGLVLGGLGFAAWARRRRV